MTNLNIENMYVKPKGLLRGLIQKLFLLLFPKKFFTFRNKIRLMMNKSGFFLRFYLTIVYLRLKYPFYLRVPSKQLYAMDMAIQFLEILKPKKIDFFLLEGSLLGAVRQESFAGRPKDVDFGIKEEQLQKLINAFPILTNNRIKNIRGIKISREKDANEIKKIQIMFGCGHIDIAVFRKKIIKENKVWIGGFYPKEITKSRNVEELTNGYAFPAADLENLITIQAYGRTFLSPTNPEIYLEKVFGRNWSKPDKKQFFWKKKKY